MLSNEVNCSSRVNLSQVNLGNTCQFVSLCLRRSLHQPESDPVDQENAIDSAQVMVRDLSPGNEPHPRPSIEQFPEQCEAACFTHFKSSQRLEKRKQQKKRKEAGIPLPPPIPATQLSDPSGTIACSHWEPFTKREGLLQIKNNSLPVKGNVSKHRKRNTTVGGG